MPGDGRRSTCAGEHGPRFPVAPKQDFLREKGDEGRMEIAPPEPPAYFAIAISGMVPPSADQIPL